MYEPFHKLKFSFLTPYYSQMRRGIEYFVKSKGKSRVCTMYQDNDFGQEVAKGVEDQLKAMNLSVISSSAHKADEKDFSAAILKMREANCDLITLGTIVVDTITPVVTARRMGWNVDFLVSVAGYTTETIVAAQGATEGLYSMTQIQAPYADSPLPAVKEWLDKYKAAFNADATLQAMAGYIAMDLFLTGVDKAGRNLTVDSLVAALEGLKYADRFGGPQLTFGPRKRIGTDVTYVSQVKGGKWTKVSDFLGS
jgi:branched-chain amino acid transport system substrate-binding protein